jgi:hypothetical protein
LRKDHLATFEKVKALSANFDDVSATTGHPGTELDGTLRWPDGGDWPHAEEIPFDPREAGPARDHAQAGRGQ